MTLPNLFVAGAQKSGTTSMHRLLETHRDIFVPARPQEIHFFDIEENFSRGLAWYEEFFSAHHGQPIVAQTSPLYLYVPDVPPRIATVCPDARFIFILRNPIDRAYSHYWHEVRYGWESLPFREAIEREPARIGGGPDKRRHYSYLDRGHYAAQLARYVTQFPRDRLHIEVFEAFVADRAAAARRIARFLAVDHTGFASAGGPESAYNRALLVRSPALQRLARGLNGRTPRLYALIERFNLRPGSYPPIDGDLRRVLRDRLHSDVETLRRLFDIDLSYWEDFA